MNENVTIQSLDPNTFEYQIYSDSDSQLIVQSQLDTIFSKDTDYIEYYVYNQNQNLIYPGSTIPLLDYDVRDGDVLLNPQKDLENTGFDLGIYNILYTFYRKRLASNISEKYFITNISSDRTEIRLDSNIINNDLIISSSNEFIQYRENADYFVDFYLNFGENQTIIANNIKLETSEGVDPTVLIKLYEPLPSNFNIKDELWVVEELSLPQAYELDFPFVPIIEDDFTFISGPNYNLNIIQETSTGGESFSFNTLLQSDVTSSINQIQNLLNQKEIDINVNYENYANFVHFSSAKIRLENFYYKVGLIESASNQLSQDHITTSPTSNTPSYRESKANLTGQIDNIIKNFDGYESFLYFNSGSQYSYPKQNTQPPFQLYSTGSTEALTWVGNATVGDPYYGGQALSSSDYDQDNRNWLYWSIPEYLRDDPANEGYELFVDMVAQYYDNVWVYTKDISNKFDADNRLEYGIAKDLVADAIKDFGVKLYASNFNTNDLFTAFLGITPSGSAFPFPEMTGSLPTESGFEYVDTKISASNDIVPLNNVQKQVYKRIYHNIPYLLKTKGTVAGIRALITSYGIPDTILRISEFGGKDRNEAQDYDLKQDVFNYAFDTGISSSNFVSSSFQSNTNFGLTTPKSIQFRFKPSSIPSPSSNIPSTNIRYSQSIFLSENGTDKSAFISLEYTGSGFVSGSYSGSSINPYDYYGTLKFFPESEEEPTLSASVYLPFFNGDWWSIQANYDVSNGSGSLYAANEIDGKIGFTDSSSILIPSGSFAPSTSFNILGSYSDHVISEGGTYEDYINLSNLLNQFLGGNYVASTTSYLNLGASVFLANKFYIPFSGSFQELRYWTQEISQSNFYDFTVNPYSNEGNGINSTPDQQFFRAALGTQLDTGSRTSIHPRITGSSVQITQSFSNNTSGFTLEGEKWVTNIEDIFQDQVPAGIKNRITNKIQAENLILAEAPYGFQTPSSSEATIASSTSDVLSPMESIQQQSFVSQSYTPNVNYLEVAFSPSNQINDDINAQLGFFNLGDYIGDPRFISSSLDSYPNLNRLRDAYFEKYIKGYDVVDFIRLIKFFDNSLFKMIKDFTPARTSLASGVVVKQHLLERNRLRPAQATSSQHVYEGLVVNLPKNYSSGSSDFPQYSTEGSALYKFSGGPGGSFNRYNGLQTSPSGSKGLGPDNRFNLTQSWTESFDYGAIDRSIINSTFFNQSSSQYISASYKGIREGVIHSDQSEFYTGIFTGSYIEVTNGNLNEGCEPYLNVVDTPIFFKPIFFSVSPGLQNTVDKSEFLNQENYPPNGYAWVASEQTTNAGTQQVFAVKLSQLDTNNVEIINYLDDFSSLRFLFNDAFLPYGSKATEYKIEGRTIFSEHALLRVSQKSGIGGNNYLQTINEDIVTANTNNLSGWAGIGGNTILSTVGKSLRATIPSGGNTIGFSTPISTVIGQVYTIKVNATKNNTDGNFIVRVNNVQGLNQSTPFSTVLPNVNSISVDDTFTATATTSYIGVVASSQNGGTTPDFVESDLISSFGDVQYYPITSSNQGGSMNWSLSANTSFNTSTSVNSESADNTQQNVLANPNASVQTQNVFFWDGEVSDTLGFFNTGSSNKNTDDILTSNENIFTNSAYTIPYTPNIPWVISASIVYSSSLEETGGSIISVDSGIYHSASLYENTNTLTNQDFTLGLDVYKMYTTATAYNSITAAEESNDPTTSDTEVFFSSTTSVFSTAGQLIYANSSLTLDLNLDGGKFYKFSNLNSNYIIVQVFEFSPPSMVATIQLTPSLASKSGISLPSLFRPSPRYVSGLGNVTFNGNTRNPQIPGNSGSGTPLTTAGGHPKIKSAGTASMDWNFPSLTLAGTVPTLTPPTPTFQPFSGSIPSPGNSDFTGSFITNNWTSPAAFAFSTETDEGKEYDGTVEIDMEKIAIVLDFQTTPGENVNQIKFAEFEIDFTADGFSTGDDMTVNWWYRKGTSGAFTEALISSRVDTTTSPLECSTTGTVIAVPYDELNDGSLPNLFFQARVKNNRTDNASFNYVISIFKVSMAFTYSTTFATNNRYPTTTNLYHFAFGGGSSGNYFQGSATNDNVLAGVTSNERFNTAIVDTYLKRTGSQGDFIITASKFSEGGGYSGSIYSGSVLLFTESPILNIFNPLDFNASTNPSSTQNEVGDMYYVEYSMSNFVGGIIGGVTQTTQNVAFQTDSDLSTIEITQSYSSTGITDFNATGSLLLTQGNRSNTTNIGTQVTNLNFNLDEDADGERVELSGSFPGNFNHNDVFRFAVRNSKVGLGSGLHIQEITASIFPSQSIWSPLTPPLGYNNYRTPVDTGLIVPSYFPGVLPFNLATDCQPLLNNFVNQRTNPYLMDIDYNFQGNTIYWSSSLAPVNFKQILSGSAVRAAVPVSNYTQLRSINPRYNGAKSTSAQLNVWSIGDTGTFGKNPTVELRDAYFGYFNDLDDPYPNINGLTRVNLSYLVDEQGNALPPSLESISIDTFKAVFPNTTVGKIAVRDINSKYQDLGSPSSINRTMEYVTPICYSQNSGENYSNTIPLSGSGYISRYDNDDNTSVSFAQFMAAGTASINTDTQQTSVEYILNPSETNVSPAGASSPYTASFGIASYPATSWGAEGNDLNNEQIISLQTSVVTTYVSETNRTDNELTLRLQMLYGQEGNDQVSVPFNLESINCKVYNDTGQVYLIKDVDSYGWFTITNVTNRETTRRRKKNFWGRSRWVYSFCTSTNSGY